MTRDQILQKLLGKRVNGHLARRYIKLIHLWSSQDHGEQNTERHHILPKSVFPEYGSFTKYPWNRAILTLRQHYLAHLLLVRMGLSRGMYFALMQTAGSHEELQERYSGSKAYEAIRTRWLEDVSVSMKRAWADPVHRKKLKASQRLAWSNPKLREKQRASQRLAWSNPKLREKQRASLKRIWADPEFRKRAGEKRQKKDVMTLQHRESARIENGTRQELIKRLNLCSTELSGLISGKRKSAKGWTLVSISAP